MKSKLRLHLALLLCAALLLSILPVAWAEDAPGVTLPENIERIEAEAFAGCAGITKLTLPANVRSIGAGAFAGLTALSEVSYAGTPGMWKRIQIGADNEPLYRAVIRFVDGSYLLPVSERFFPDAALRACVKGFDLDGDNMLSEAERTAVKTLDVASRGVVSLEGAQYFTKLQTLTCDHNPLTALDLSVFPELGVLSAADTGLASIDLSRNPKLYRVQLGFNRLETLDLSKNTALQYLDVKGNQLKELDVSASSVLTELVYSGKLTKNTESGVTYVTYTGIHRVEQDTDTVIYQTLAVDQSVTLQSDVYIDKPSDFRIGIITGSPAQSEDEYRGAMGLQTLYGADMVRVETYPDDFINHQDAVTELIASMADDPRMKAVIVNQAVPGTADGFARIKNARPDILCIAGEPHEDLSQLSYDADLVLMNDYVSRGYLMVRTAHELGCNTFVQISFPRHMSYETMARRAAVMRAACEEFGMSFVQETAPDPTTDVGVVGAQAYIMEHAPQWAAKYGQKAAYFCTNDAHVEPLIRQLLTCGGYFIESDLPSPTLGYPGALGVDLSDLSGKYAAILRRVEQAVTDQGGAGRFGTWAYSYGYTLSAGLGQHAINAIQDPTNYDLLDRAKLFASLRKYTPNAAWNGSYYTEAGSGAMLPNVFLVYQDTYIMGNPGRYMGTTSVTVPEKYFTVK